LLNTKKTTTVGIQFLAWERHNNVDGMNSVDVFATVKIHWKHYRSCVTHLCTSGTTSHKPLCNDWLVLCVGDVKLSLLQEVVTHVTELLKPPYCMTISVCPWFVLIMMLRNFVDIALFVMPIWIEIIQFLSIFFLYVKHFEHQTLVSFLLLTCIFLGLFMPKCELLQHFCFIQGFI